MGRERDYTVAGVTSSSASQEDTSSATSSSLSLASSTEMVNFPINHTKEASSVVNRKKARFPRRASRVIRQLKTYRDKRGTETDENGHILGYQTKFLFYIGFILPRHSIWTGQILIRIVFMALLTTLFGFLGCTSSATTNYFNLPLIAKIPSWNNICIPTLSASDGLIFSSIVSFLLGLFQSLTFSRWWAVREKIGAITTRSTDVAMQLCMYIKSAPDSDFIRENCIRYLNAAHALVYKQATKDENLDDLVSRELLTEQEQKLLYDNQNKPFTVYMWLLQLVREASATSKIVPPNMHGGLQSNVSALITASGDVNMFITTQIPYAYVHLLTLITKIHLVFVTFYAGSILRGAFDTMSWPRILFAYAVVFFNQLIYEGLLQIHDILVNPCGEDAMDFPKHTYQVNLENITKSFLDPAHEGVLATTIAAEKASKLEGAGIDTPTPGGNDDDNDDGANKDNTSYPPITPRNSLAASTARQDADPENRSVIIAVAAQDPLMEANAEEAAEAQPAAAGENA